MVTEYTQTTQLGVPEVLLITPTSYSLHKQSWYNDYKSHDCYLLKGQTVQQPVEPVTACQLAMDQTVQWNLSIVLTAS